ncbi:MAG TPA: hypothetical protein VE987_21300, partial [Polyangiaceae bacterium]|nr:hypothetical protein [Polyangiaceae bacterium]
MGQGPEPDCTWAIDETPQWIARERDAAWTAKLVILRVQRLDDIAHFGDCLREHERHIEELAHLTRAQTGGTEAWTYREPSFVTRDPHVIG